MKKLIAFAAVGLFAASSLVSTGAWAECAGHGKVAETKQPTVTLAPATAQTASTGAKTAKPDS